MIDWMVPDGAATDVLVRPRARRSHADNGNLIETIAQYWNAHIHDLAIAKHPVGTLAFFKELEDYRFDKLRYLPQVVGFDHYKNKSILEVGCGIGIDLLRFAKAGARVIGIDIARQSIDLAKKNFELNGVDGELYVMDGEATQFDDNSFDMVYAHGVLQYTANARKMIAEIHRVLKPGGHAIMMVYNRLSWLNALSKVMKVELEHEDAPVLNKYSIREFREMASPFSRLRIVPERFPVASKLHNGWKGTLYNQIFVPAFQLVPRPLVRPLGWHLMAFGYK